MQQRQDETIEKYMTGAMNNDERRAFEEQMAGNPELAEAIRVEKWMQAAAADQEWIALRRQLQQADQRGGGTNRPFLRPVWIWTSAAAAILLLAVWSILHIGRPASPPDYTAYFEPYPLVLQQRGETSDRAELQETYGAGDFQAAIPLLEEWADQDPGDITPVFYLGIAQLADNHPEKATGYLQKAAASETAFAEQAGW
ncbi:MAG TPA: tetratricopeptide repeat protein, partial [Flavilitoribacter sp.]|nr:tetratricopeptide repeat protein [Flavilitoribacter sp.]